MLERRQAKKNMKNRTKTEQKRSPGVSVRGHSALTRSREFLTCLFRLGCVSLNLARKLPRASQEHRQGPHRNTARGPTGNNQGSHKKAAKGLIGTQPKAPQDHASSPTGCWCAGAGDDMDMLVIRLPSIHPSCETSRWGALRVPVGATQVVSAISGILDFCA